MIEQAILIALLLLGLGCAKTDQPKEIQAMVAPVEEKAEEPTNAAEEHIESLEQQETKGPEHLSFLEEHANETEFFDEDEPDGAAFECVQSLDAALTEEGVGLCGYSFMAGLVEGECRFKPGTALRILFTLDEVIEFLTLCNNHYE